MGKWQNFKDECKRDRVKVLSLCGEILIVIIITTFKIASLLDEPFYDNVAYADCSGYASEEVSLTDRCLLQIERAKEVLVGQWCGLFGCEERQEQE